MSHGLLWLPLLLVFVLLTALGWLERRRQHRRCLRSPRLNRHQHHQCRPSGPHPQNK